MCSRLCLDLNLSHILHWGETSRGSESQRQTPSCFSPACQLPPHPHVWRSPVFFTRSDSCHAAVTVCRVWSGWVPPRTRWAAPCTRRSRGSGWGRAAGARTARKSPRKSTAQRSPRRRGWSPRCPESKPATGRVSRTPFAPSPQLSERKGRVAVVSRSDRRESLCRSDFPSCGSLSLTFSTPWHFYHSSVARQVSRHDKRLWCSLRAAEERTVFIPMQAWPVLHLSCY